MLNIDKRIKLIISNVFDIEENLVKDDSSNDSLDQWDSMNHMNLIVALEEEFECEFDEEDIENMINFNVLKNTIEDKLLSNK